MKIYYTYPFDLSHTILEADLDRDFVKYDIHTKGQIESNKFLLSLWHEMNISISPENSPNRVPWAYFPNRFIGKKTSASVLGFAQTSLGEFLVVISYRTKGDIDSIHFMSVSSGLKIPEAHVSEMAAIIESAKKHINNTFSFTCSAKIHCSMKGVTMSNYSGTMFSISPSDYGTFCLKFIVNAIDTFEAEQNSLEALYDFCAFMSVETNIRCSFDDYEISDGEMLDNHESPTDFVRDYIDGYMIDKDRIYISTYAYEFLNSHLFNKPRLIPRQEVDRFFLSACKHCQLAMESDEKLGLMSVAAAPEYVIALERRDQLRKEENISTAIMSYLSALECATASDANPAECPLCHNKIYKISHRVRELATRYLGEDLGKVLYELYGFRSKFLHAGKLASDSNIVRTVPLINVSTGTCLVDISSVSVRVNGLTFAVSIENVKEWTTYCLRCFYQEKILGRTTFDRDNVQENLSVSSDFPLQISAISPEGGEAMKHLFKFNPDK